jgi:molybdopterin synthase catalytic subunit
MKVVVRLFASLKDKAQTDRLTIELPESATVADMQQQMMAAYPHLAQAVGASIVAVNQAFADADTAVEATDEIAMFPPVSGGEANQLPYPTYFAITTKQIDLNTIHAILRQPTTGAIVSFTGSVRGQTNREGLPDETIYLEYEAYSEMAEAKMEQIAREIWQQWPSVHGVALVQRIGRLAVEDVTTFVACASPHRDQGVFEAARYGIDRLKEIVPVWKKEVGPDNTVWVEGHYHPSQADNI